MQSVWTTNSPFTSMEKSISFPTEIIMNFLERKPVVRYAAKNIRWDTDGDREAFDSLPQKVILPGKFSKENYEDENGFFGEAEKIEMQDDISDWLSNEYGFCHDGFELTQKEV